ncbi:Cullin-domain-containing protein [Thozetella sp. PMI_491]|nr:Cullin-domain-containing protein [Thozetella sp. PMI_491]
MASRGKIRSVRKPQMAKESSEFEPCWQLIEQALVDIHTRNAGRLSFEQLYRASYKIVLRKQGQQLYERVKSFEENWFKTRIVPEIIELTPRNVALTTLDTVSANERRQMGEKFLRGLRDKWQAHNLAMNMAADILMYLERTYMTELKGTSVFAATIGLYRSMILAYDLGIPHSELDRNICISDFLIALIIGLINMEREGDVIDKALVRESTLMLEQLYETDDEVDDHKLYLTVFEPAYLEASRKFYREECEKLLRDSDAGTWLRHTRRRLQEELDRCRTTVALLTSPKIAKVVEDELVSRHLNEFLALDGSGIKSMIDNDRIEDLAILYGLVSRVDPSREPLKVALQNRVLELGFEIEKDLRNTDFSAPAPPDDQAPKDGDEKPKVQLLTVAAQTTAAAIKWVDDVLKLKDKFDQLWENCFEKDLLIQSAITRSFSQFINRFERSSEFVSLFIDDNLKRGIRGKTEAEVDLVLDKAIILVRYLSDRDMFERYYQKHLAKRLLHGKSESQDVEKEMVSRMKQDMGNAFTGKFEGMFKDMELSRDLTDGYREHIRNLGEVEKDRIDLGIHVLTSNSWPPEVMGRQGEDGTRSECIFPPAIKRLQESFYKYYLKDRSGRVLTWIGTGGSAEIKCFFPKVSGKETGPLSRDRRYELTVGTHGMIVLLLFNEMADGESLSYEEIQAKTNIPAQELARTLVGLSIYPKARVLTKDPATKSVKPGDKFSYNAQFVSKTIKIKVPTVSTVSKVEGDEERKETTRKNDETRWHLVDAAIVRIMKQRKQLPHSQLVTEVITQLSARFKPEVPMIKRRIEDLINREYLTRLDGDTSTYQYVA